MDFVSGFPLTQKKHDSVWVIVDRLTKSAHFLPVWLDYSMDRLAELYVNEIVRLHGICGDPRARSDLIDGSEPKPRRSSVITQSLYQNHL